MIGGVTLETGPRPGWLIYEQYIHHKGEVADAVGVTDTVRVNSSDVKPSHKTIPPVKWDPNQIAYPWEGTFGPMFRQAGKTVRGIYEFHPQEDGAVRRFGAFHTHAAFETAEKYEFRIDDNTAAQHGL